MDLINSFLSNIAVNSALLKKRYYKQHSKEQKQIMHSSLVEVKTVSKTFYYISSLFILKFSSPQL